MPRRLNMLNQYVQKGGYFRNEDNYLVSRSAINISAGNGRGLRLIAIKKIENELR